METKNAQQSPKTPFAAALTYFLEQKGWGANTQLAKSVGVKPPYISELASGRKKGKEDKRRAIAEALDLPYEHFLAFGEFLLGGVPGAEALEKVRDAVARGAIVRYIPPRPPGMAEAALPVPAAPTPSVSAAQTGGVNHGTVASIVQAAPSAPVVSSPASGIQPVVGGGEIERDLCERIVRRMANQTTEEKIAFHTRMKKCIEEDGLESVKE